MHSLRELEGGLYLSGVPKETCLQAEERKRVGGAVGFVLSQGS